MAIQEKEELEEEFDGYSDSSSESTSSEETSSSSDDAQQKSSAISGNKDDKIGNREEESKDLKRPASLYFPHWGQEAEYDA